jgi:glycosyltransferase involved in cell wall biosynthesis
MSERPLVTLIVVTYNQEQFVHEAVQGALAQTYEPLEIIFSDDCSPDGTYDVISKDVSTYKGPHQIVLNRNPKNLGLSGNLNRCWELSSGQFVVVQAGDDISVPERTQKLVTRWLDTKSPVDLVCSYFAEIDVNGKPTGFIKKGVTFVPDLSKDVLSWKCGATGACAAYSRKLYEKYGPIDTGVLAEDWVYSFRAWLESGIAVVEEPLVLHRTHENCISVMHRDINALQDKDLRRRTRRRGEENQLAIAREWLRAWQIGGKNGKLHVFPSLQRLVKLREFQFRACDATRVEAIKLAALLLTNGGGFVDAAKLLVRYAVRWN